jgi:CRISPR/Cas system-associated protein endoribonuclease Cas2
MEKNKTGKYFKYAIGEIILVVIGILIALSINNWNENRKAKNLAQENYLNLLTSLEQDSITVNLTFERNMIGLDALRKIIPLEKNVELLELTEENLNKYLMLFGNASRSFIPKSGVYNLLTSNNGFDLIKSDKIKSLLINLYDYQYKAYEDLDSQIDNKYHNQLGSIMREKIGIVVEYTPELSITQSTTPELFEKHYFELASESRDIFGMLSFNKNNLIQIEQSINELISLIRDEIKK